MKKGIMIQRNLFDNTVEVFYKSVLDEKKSFKISFAFFNQNEIDKEIKKCRINEILNYLKGVVKKYEMYISSQNEVRAKSYVVKLSDLEECRMHINKISYFLVAKKLLRMPIIKNKTTLKKLERIVNFSESHNVLE